MKKLLLFLLAFFCLPMQAMKFRVYNGYPQAIWFLGDNYNKNFNVSPQKLSDSVQANSKNADVWEYGLVDGDFSSTVNTSMARGMQDPVIVVEPIKNPYAITYNEWRKRFGPTPAPVKIVVPSIPDSIAIHLPASEPVQLDVNEPDGISFASTFKELIEEQFAKGDSYILARVVDMVKKPNPSNPKESIIDESHRPKAHYFDAHNFNFYLFKTVDLAAIAKKTTLTGQTVGSIESANESIFNEHGETGSYPIRFQQVRGIYNPVTREYSYLDFFRVPVNKLQINPAIGVQYFVLRPERVADGFQYLCSYTAAKGFYNDVADSPFKGQAQTFFLDYFYANQNGDTNSLKQLKIQKKPHIADFEKKIKHPEKAAVERKREQAEEDKKSAAQDKFAIALQAAKQLYETGDKESNYQDAINKLLLVYREAPDMQRYEAACLLGEIYHKGGKNLKADNRKAVEYLQAIHGGPCLERAQELLTQIAVEESMRVQHQQRQTGAETKVNRAETEAKRSQEEADREAAQRLQEDADRLAARKFQEEADTAAARRFQEEADFDPELAAALAASMQS
jgi:hypothetical protein